MLELICDKPQTLKEFTENNYAQASFAWTSLLKNREMKVNGKRVSGDIPLRKGDVATYYLTEKQAAKPAYFAVYEDENVLVVDKESGVNSEAVFAALQREGEYYFLHRLDRNTKGLLLFAKKESTANALLTAFRERAVEKVYHALCFGEPLTRRALLTAYLQKDAEKSLARVFDEQVKGSEKICTEYEVLERLEGGMSLLKVILHTGKTHQISAHLAHIGCPIVGDMKYGDTAANKALHCARQCLVAKELTLEVGGELAYLSGKTFVSRFAAEIGK